MSVSYTSPISLALSYTCLAALPTALRGLNAMLMNQYVEYVADFLLWRLGFPALYGQTNPVHARRSNVSQFTDLLGIETEPTVSTLSARCLPMGFKGCLVCTALLQASEFVSEPAEPSFSATELSCRENRAAGLEAPLSKSCGCTDQSHFPSDLSIYRLSEDNRLA